MTPLPVLLIGGPAGARRLLRHLLEAERDIEVIGELADTLDGWRQLRQAPVDAILMDAAVLAGAGLQLIEDIMSERPLPILLLSDAAAEQPGSAVTHALRRGALMAHRRPAPADAPAAAALRAVVRLVAKIPVVRHPRMRPAPAVLVAAPRPPPLLPAAAPRTAPPAELVGIASSAGGPAILAEILAELPTDFAACVLVVQHLPIGFAAPFAAFLRARVQLPVLVACEPLPLQPGQIILAPDDAHLEIKSRGRCAGVRSPPLNAHRPSADRLFATMAHCYGAATVGVVLSGIGRDGTLGLHAIREQGGLTIAQDGESAVVNGMPRAACESGAAALCLPPAAIVQAVLAACLPAPRGAFHGE
jgi:two-component system chemotaxis response regulator CheB